ncbi:MAG TPA: serine hydrolase domain-containing protein, partial [bacterium]|nr:serine hydrolase domain-containing protein [bacterium]
MAPLLADDQLSGSLLVAVGDSALVERCWGFANREHGTRVTPDTPILVASVTKPMTIVLVSRLAEQRLLLPDQTLAEWIPDVPGGADITVSHLLNHRAAIPHRVTMPEEEVVPRTAADLVERVKRAERLPHAPGEVSVYSPAGFSVLAR